MHNYALLFYEIYNILKQGNKFFVFSLFIVAKNDNSVYLFTQGHWGREDSIFKIGSIE